MDVGVASRADIIFGLRASMRIPPPELRRVFEAVDRAHDAAASLLRSTLSTRSR